MSDFNKILKICNDYEKEEDGNDFKKYNKAKKLAAEYSFNNEKFIMLSMLSFVFMGVSIVLQFNLLFWLCFSVSISVSLVSSFFSQYYILQINNIPKKSINAYLRFQLEKNNLSRKLSINEIFINNIDFKEESNHFNEIVQIFISDNIDSGFNRLNENDTVKAQRIFSRHKKEQIFVSNKMIFDFLMKDETIKNNSDNENYNLLTINNT